MLCMALEKYSVLPIASRKVIFPLATKGDKTKQKKEQEHYQ